MSRPNLREIALHRLVANGSVELIPQGAEPCIIRMREDNQYVCSYDPKFSYNKPEMAINRSFDKYEAVGGQFLAVQL